MNVTSSAGLPGKYRPETLSDLRGQPAAVASLTSFIKQMEAEPCSSAFVFEGDTGIGKTAAAWALAFDLGCSKDCPEFGGVFEIPSGAQDGKAVNDLLTALRVRPLMGSGWRVAIINEADGMTKQAEMIWLDGLENLPPKTVIVFTTNDASKLSRRLVGRCEVIHFRSKAAEIGEDLANMVREVWRAETGKVLRHVPEHLGRWEMMSDSLSFRLALQQIAPYIRTGERMPKRMPVPLIREPGAVGSEAANKAWETRRRQHAERQVACG